MEVRNSAPCVLADEAVLEQLSSQAGQAPLHLPVVISLVRACQHVLPQMPVILTFQSAFFADLPARERSYGLDPDMAARLGLQRTGQYGLYHAAACSHLVHLHKDEAKPPRIISICLDHQNELAAVLGRRPLLVTSGATTLEGLPGLTTTGEMDPSITLTLARELKWGPEQINRVLTQESGLRGLAGEPVTTLALFRSRANSSKLARDVMQYRLLLACGSAIAAMGGVDEIIFTGRYAEAGNRLGPWLCERLTRSRGMGNVSWRLCAQSLEQIVAELTVTTLAVSTDQAA